MYFALSLTALAILLLIPFSAVGLRNHPKINSWIIFSLAFFLLVYKTIEYSYYAITHTGYSPIEFSHLSYLIFGTVFFLGIRSLKFFASFVAALSGLGFFLGVFVSPASIYSDAYLMTIGYISHGFLYLGGLLGLFCHEYYPLRKIWKSILGLSGMLLYGVLVYCKVLYNIPDPVESSNFVRIISGNYLYPIFGQLNPFFQTMAALGIINAVLFLLIGVNIFSDLVICERSEEFNVKGKTYKPLILGVIPYLTSHHEVEDNTKKV